MVEPYCSVSNNQLRAYLKIRRDKYWVKRFLVLSNGMLHYYKKPTSLSPRVILQLANTTVKDLGKQKNEYILEILKGTGFKLLISFVNERDHIIWFEVLKRSSITENEQKSLDGANYSSTSKFKANQEENRQLINSIPITSMQAILQQRIKELTQRNYKLVGTKGACPYFIAQQNPQEKPKPSRLSNIYLILGLSLIVGMILNRLQFDWLIATIALAISLVVYMGGSFKDTQDIPLNKVSFKCTAVVYAGLGKVLTALNENMSRCSWEPYVTHVSGNTQISVTYSIQDLRIVQEISRQFIQDDQTYYLIEKNGPDFKYIFQISPAESQYEDRTSVSLFGSTSEADLSIGNPEALMSLKHFVELWSSDNTPNMNSIIINDEELLEEDLESHEETSLSISAVPDEKHELILGYTEEANRVLKDAQELMAETEGWERLKLNIPGINAARRKVSGGLNVIMSQGIINRTPEDIMAYIKDINRKAEYDPMFESGRIVEEFPEEMEVAYQKYKKTGPVSARDFCFLQKRFYISDSYIAAVATSVNHPDVPDSQCVRAHLYMGCFMIEKIDQSRTKVTYMVHVDVKGSIPKFIVNKVQNEQGKLVHFIAEMLKS